MCTGFEIAMLASAAVGTTAAVRSGQQQKKFNNYQAKQAEADADAEKGAAAVRADSIRKLARMKSGEATAQMGAAGVDVGEGTALRINEDIIYSGEMDALTGVDDSLDAASRLRAEAKTLRLQGSQAQTAGYATATSTALAAGSNYGKGWKTSSTPHGTPEGPK
jgi:Iap family predicted aminopeptidase